MNSRKPFSILIAEDDDDDQMLIRESFEENKIINPLYYVKDGVELIDFLKCTGKYSEQSPIRPGLILLDLNMPIKDGREALAEIKQDFDLRRIPIVVLTTSNSEIDIFKTYDSGVNSYITKPVTFESLVEIIKKVSNYWFEIVQIPKNGNRSI